LSLIPTANIGGKNGFLHQLIEFNPRLSTKTSNMHYHELNYMGSDAQYILKVPSEEAVAKLNPCLFDYFFTRINKMTKIKR